MIVFPNAYVYCTKILYKSSFNQKNRVVCRNGGAKMQWTMYIYDSIQWQLLGGGGGGGGGGGAGEGGGGGAY